MPETFLDSYAESSTGLLLVANGLDAVLRWDGLAAAMVAAGMAAPPSAVTLGETGTGGIVGTYFAYLRWVDNLGNVSDLSPVSAALVPSSSTGTVTNATNATPIVITSSGHGLTTGQTVQVQGVGGNTAANGTYVVTVIDANNFSLNGSSGAAPYTGGGTWARGVSQINYTAVAVPTDAKVARRQILRNTDGQADVFYVDVDTTDLASTSFNSTNTDSTLSAQIAVPILDADGNPLANLHGPPPAHKLALAQANGRLFAAGERAYSLGNVVVTNGSTAVTGVGTAWPATLAGRFLYVVGATQAYQIASVNTSAQTLALTTAYADTTDAFALYAVKPAPAEARLVYYTEAGLPESWPVINALSVQADGDEIVGLMVQSTWIYILERRHIYRLTFHADPATDGAVFLVAQRGCVNNRCWAVVDDHAYLLDEQGVYSFDGDVAEPVSEAIQLVFRPGASGYYSINWRAKDFFHCVHYVPQETLRWFVALAGEDFPRHALVYQYRAKRWWVEQFAAPVASAAVGVLSGSPQVFLGSDAKRVLAFWQGSLDGPDPGAGTVRGSVSSAGPLTLTDATASYAAAGLAGSPVAIVAGTGKGQVRRVAAASGQTITVDQPWLVRPDATSVYQLGAISWAYRSGWFRWAQGEEHQERRAEVVFSPVPTAATMDVHIHLNFQDTPVSWGLDRTIADGTGVQSSAGSADLVIDLTKPNGFVQQRFGSHREFYLDGPRFVQLGLVGFSTQDLLSVYSAAIDGAVH